MLQKIVPEGYDVFGEDDIQIILHRMFSGIFLLDCIQLGYFVIFACEGIKYHLVN